MLGTIERVIYISLLVAMGCVMPIIILRQRRSKARSSVHSRLIRLSEAMREGYLGLDANYRVVEVNSSYLQMTGYRRSELIGRHIESLSVINEREGPLFEQLKNVRIDRPALYRGQHRAKDGSLLPIEVSVASFDEGEVAFICLYRDLREQIKAERAVQHTLELLRYVVEHTRSAVAVFDASMRYLFVSEKYRQEYGIEPHTELLGLSHYEVVPDLPQRWKEIHQRALAGEVLKSEEDSFERLDGNMEYRRWECRPWHESDGTIGGMILYTENITEQKNVEWELTEARDYLSTLITQANAPIVVWDEEFIVVRANLAFANLFGMEVGQIVSRHIKVVEGFIAESDFAQVSQLIDRKERVKALELGIKQSDGSVKTVLWTLSVVYADKDGKPLAYIAQGHDISERKRIEEENRSQLEMLRRWYAVMAHREDRVMELKEEVNTLLGEAGRPIRYNSVQKRGQP